MKNKYKYDEPTNSLDNRISAHANFSNFNLHNWISLKFNIKNGDNIFDVGCGNGNYTELFFSKTLENGVIYGLDKNKDLIVDANSKHKSLSKNVHFQAGDYDLVDNINVSFDWVFSIYSLYYTSDSQALVDKLKNLLHYDGSFVVIGPASANALDLDRFHFNVTGLNPNAEHRLRNKRIEDEFYPLFKSIFGDDNVELEIIDTKMSFPVAHDYAEYYWSTLLWRECIEKLDTYEIKTLKSRTLDLLSKCEEFNIEKQMACLIGNNK
jgi:ubiquinone/menaquinone biosynthesis C-methylase UbiE